MRRLTPVALLATHRTYRKALGNMLAGLCALALLQYLAWLVPAAPGARPIPNYLPLHTLLETMSIVVSMMVFAVGWNARASRVAGNLIVLASGFLAVAVLDFLHTVSYTGMPDFVTVNDNQKHLNFWLAGRVLAAVVLLAATVRPWRPFERAATARLLLYGQAGAVAVFTWVVLAHQDWLPELFVAGTGLTPLKKGVEYGVIVTHLVTAALLLVRMRHRQPFNVVLLFGAVVVLGMSEFFFTLYTSMTGSYNVLGHLYKSLAYLLIYRAAVVETIEAPFNKLTKLSEKNLALLRNASDGIHILDADGKVIEASESFCRMLGYPRSAVIGMHVSQWDANWNGAAPHARPEGQIKHTERSLFETRHRRRDGSLFDVEVSVQALMLDGQRVLFKSSRDISERKRAEETLRVVASVFDNAQEGIVITNADNEIMEVNAAFTRITGYARADVVGKRPHSSGRGQDEHAFHQAMCQQLKTERSWRGELWERRKSGEVFPEICSVSAVCDESGRVLRHVAVFSDISQVYAHRDELNRAAHYDALTGMPNRLLLADRMKHAIAQAAREHSLMAVCYLDLDGFKQLNDTFGRAAGDTVLIEVAHRIVATVRSGDTVARLGGDEFVVLLQGLKVREEWVATLERLMEAIVAPVTVQGQAMAVTASIGVGVFPIDDTDPDTLLRHANHAMMMAKHDGKNRFHIYDPTLDQRAQVQMEMLKEIRQGLDNGQFVLHYQPKVDLRTRALVGAEALIRWQHPQRGLLAPGEFLHFIDGTALDIALGEWVMARALAQLAAWQEQGLQLEVSINISGYHLESPGFMPYLRAQLAQHPGLGRGALQIEVLETVALRDLGAAAGIVAACRALGVGFALDDFGTGYSSLAYLSSLPVDVLKIDQSFVRVMLEDAGAQAIIHGVIALARAFARTTVAEGVESMAHFDALLAMGCELGQGYGIGRPMPPAQLAAWHDGWRAQAADCLSLAANT